MSKHAGQTQLNKNTVPYQGLLVLNHKDVFTIGDRSFRWEYPEESQHIVAASASTASSKKTPSKKTPLTPKDNGNNNSSASGSCSVAKKGEGYGVMSPKAKVASAKKTPKKSKNFRENIVFSKFCI